MLARAGRTCARGWGQPALAAPAAAAARRTLCSSPLRLEPALESAIARFRTSTLKSGSDRSTIVDEFSSLQSRRVKKVLLLCSDYDSYTFEEEGMLSEVIFQEYAHLNLRTPPSIERVGSTEKAISRLRESPGAFDMVITLMRNANSFVSAVHNVDQSLPIALIALSPTELTCARKHSPSAHTYPPQTPHHLPCHPLPPQPRPHLHLSPARLAK
jgi:hypothetical protein